MATPVAILSSRIYSFLSPSRRDLPRPVSSQISRRLPRLRVLLRDVDSPLPHPRIMNRDYRVSTRRNSCVVEKAAARLRRREL